MSKESMQQGSADGMHGHSVQELKLLDGVSTNPGTSCTSWLLGLIYFKQADTLNLGEVPRLGCTSEERG